MSVVDDSYGYPMKAEEAASDPFAGGIVQHGFQCGMLWGAALAAGAAAHRHYGLGPAAETGAMVAAERLVDSFRTRDGHIDCIDITSLDMRENSGIAKFFLKGGPIGCFRMAARYAPIARDEIDAALAGEPFEAADGPVSCTAVLAQKMGVSETHVTMAAGLAGGIGLSGGACGALGAAIWLTKLKKGGNGSSDLMDPDAMAVLDHFVEASDYEFECAEIAGRRFDSIGDHASYVRDGGCSEIIEALVRHYVES